jgi:uncharacterized damage-inducible protein DinB
MTPIDPIRAALSRLLDWEDAHVGFDAAVSNLPAALQGRTPDDLPYAPWQLLEHLRLTQRDILEFCVDVHYQERAWPDDYWPKMPKPPSATAWADSVAQFLEDRDALKRLAANPEIDLLARVPAGNGQTFLREILLVADHSSYHLGQLVAVRRALGAWPPASAS